MIIVLIIIAYILNVFLNRWLDYILCKKYNFRKSVPFWFLPIIGTIIFLGCIIIEYFDKPNWFTGRDWDKK